MATLYTAGIQGYPAEQSMPDMSRFGGLLKAARLKRGLSQEGLARRLGYSLKAYNRLENGEVDNPEPERVGRLSQVLAIPLADLYREAGWVSHVADNDEHAALDELWGLIPEDKRTLVISLMRALASLPPPAEPRDGQKQRR